MRICFITFILALCICPPVFADGMYIPQIDPSSRVQDIKEPTQKAIIVFADKKERLILQTTYTGKVSNFVWVVPTPNIVKVDKAESYVFDKFHEITAPRLKYWFNADAAKHLWTFSRGGPDNEILPEVDVLGKKKIGVYDVIVLRSRKAEDLIKWLNDNKYQVPQNIEPILDDYIKRGWVFTISKVNAAGFKDKNKQITGNLEPLAFDFNTNEPVFPLKLSSLNKGKTRILIYTVTTSKMDCKELKTLYASDGNHERKMRYYFHRIYYATKGFQPFQNTSVYNMWVTKFTAELSSKKMNADLVLNKSALNTTVFPKDKYVPFYRSIVAILVVPVYLLIGILGGALYLVIPMILLLKGIVDRNRKLWIIAIIIWVYPFLIWNLNVMVGN